jgi:hypothetical protein
MGLLSPNGRWFVQINPYSDRLEVLDADGGCLLATRPGFSFTSVVSCCLTPDGKRVIGEFDGAIVVWDFAKGKEVARLGTDARFFGERGLSADGTTVVTAEVENGMDLIRRLRVWDLKRKREIGTFAFPGQYVTGFSLSADGKRLSVDLYQLKQTPFTTVWDVQTGRLLGRVPTCSGQTEARLSPDGRFVAVVQCDVSGNPERIFRVHEVATSSGRFVFRHESSVLNGVVFSPNGKILAASNSKATIYLWDLTGDLYGTLPWDPALVNAVWEDLGSGNAARGFTAIRRLRANPTPALVLLAERIKLPVAPDAAALKKLFADLASDEYEDREKAEQALTEFDEAIRPALVKELAQAPSAEARERLRRILDRLEGMTPLRLRMIRAVEAVEGMGTVEADALLAKWAKEPAGSVLEAEATAALARRKK